MSWETVTVEEQKKRFINDWLLNYFSISDLANRFSISRKTAHKWINKFKEGGYPGLRDLPRTPHSCSHATPEYIVHELITQKEKHPSWGPRKLLKKISDTYPNWDLPADSTVSRILDKHGLVTHRKNYRRLHPGCPMSQANEPNDIWATDYKGQFRLKDSSYCYPLTTSDLNSRMLLLCSGHPHVSLELSKECFISLFRKYGLPKRMRSDNGVPFASNAIARLSKLNVFFIKQGIYPELIEPGKPQQNGIHERMHRTLKQDATIPPSQNLKSQQRRFDRFIHEFNYERPHESLGMKTPAEVYHRSSREYIENPPIYDYPSHFLVRRVSHSGTVRCFVDQFYLSSTLVEEYVGFEEIDDDIFDVFFCFYLIGRYNHRKKRLEEVISRSTQYVSSKYINRKV